jgi:hypothetical protein
MTAVIVQGVAKGFQRRPNAGQKKARQLSGYKGSSGGEHEAFMHTAAEHEAGLA